MTAKVGRATCAALVALASAAPVQSAPSLANRDAGAHPAILAKLSDGRRLNFRCSGQGRVTVLFESGYAGDSLAWYKVQPTLAQRYRVCAYDRAGSGFSDAGPVPRDGSAIARDLDQGLRAAAIHGPFIMVAHSSGGLYARVFTGLRARDVQGLVLVDPSIAYQDRRASERFGPGAGSLQGQIDRARRCQAAAIQYALPSSDPALKDCAPTPGSNPERYAAQLDKARDPGTWRDQISELETLWTSTSAEAEAANPAIRDKPLIVLTADRTYGGTPSAALSAADDFWTGVHRDIAGLSTRGREVRVARTSHMMMFDRPDAIIDAVDDVAHQVG